MQQQINIEDNVFAYSDRKGINEKENQSLSSKKKTLKIIIPIISLVLIGLIIGIIIFVKKGKDKKTKLVEEETKTDEETKSEEETKSNEIAIIPGEIIKNKKLESEFEIITNAGDLKRIYVFQKSDDETKINGKYFQTKVVRKTNYDIYIISEELANEENKLYYSKIYTAAISIESECIGIDIDDCEPEEMLNLTKEKIKSNANYRILNNAEDYKDLSIPLCIFNITDNDFIISISCPESISESKKNEILLDLYFFRPPAIERADKKRDNITITKNEDKEKNRKYIRETNGGTCNIFNNLDSMCTTDMNTTTDLEGHLLQYDELAITNITTDENNYYIKKKVTHLLDETDKIDNLNPLIFKNALENLLPNLEPYMKLYIEFTIDNFKDLYNIVRKKANLDYKKKQKKSYRNLLDMAIEQSNEAKEANIFFYNDAGGININYNLINDPSLKGEALKIFSNLLFDDENRELVYLNQFTNLSYIIDKLSILSKAGNHLASELLNQTNHALNNITNDISSEINALKEIIKYYDLSVIFDSTSSLSSLTNLNPSIIIETDNLVNNLNDLYNGIKTGDLREYADNLNLKIHNYLIQSHTLLKTLFDNLKELSDILKSVNNRLTEITTYYLNYTPSSYVDTVEKAKNILENYYINEKNLIIKKVNDLLNEFEISMNTTLGNDIKKIDILYNNFNNGTFIIDSNEEDYERLKTNLLNSKKYISNIINRIKEFINEKIGLKDNGYFITDNELKTNNNSFSYVITKSEEVSKKLDNDEYIDKKFDEVMTNFRQNYTNIIKYMNSEKKREFVLDEDILDDNLFSSDVKKSIEASMQQFRANIINKINEENDYYLENIKTNITLFMNQDLGTLNSILSDLDVIFFSEDSLKTLSDLFNKAFNSCLNKTINDLITNELLTKEYFDKLYNVINDNTFLYNLLKSYKTNEIPQRKRFGIINRSFKFFQDTIYSKEKTNGYLTKYNQYIAQLKYSKTYIADQLYLDLLNEYKEILSQIREILQSVKNNKNIFDKYPDFGELKFFKEHMETINNFYDRFDKYFSDKIFNNKFIPNINNQKNIDNQKITSIENYIGTKHKTINSLALNADNVNDFCFKYQRKVCYGCYNCAWYYYAYDTYCYPLTASIKNNHLKLIKSEIESDTNLKNFKIDLEHFTSQLKEKINNYNSIIKKFGDKLNLVKTDTLNRKITKDYLTPFENWVNSTLNEKYGNIIINESYYHYQKIIKERLENILSKVSDKWNECFDILCSEVDKYYDNFTGTTYEFGIMAQAYETLITENITKNYFDSIELFQKTEFNYTISYYYDYFTKIVKQAYQYVINSIPTNRNGFVDIINLRKNEIINNFNNYFRYINNSFNEDISIKKQKYVLLVSEDDFFNVYNILSDNIISTSNSLKQKYANLYDYEKIGDQFSVVARYYLENSENARQIAQFYSSVNNNSFVELNLYKFTEILLNNWIFDRNDFISKLNESLFNSTMDIEKDLEFHNDTQSKNLENEIIKILKNESIENKISNFYLSEIKDLSNNNINNIKTNINEILNKIKENIINQANLLKTQASSYNNNYDKIKSTLNEYKNEIFNKLNTTIFSVLNGFHQNMMNNVYNNYIDSGLNQYITEAKKETSTNENCKDFPLLNSTYKIGKIIEELLEKIINKYKVKTIKVINFKYEQYYIKIKNLINLDEIKKTINKQINDTYYTYLLPALKQFATNNPGDNYIQYDFDDTIKSGINEIITQKMENIQKIISLTKGNNYNVDIYLNSWEIMSFTKVTFNVIRPMCKSYNDYLSNEENEQNSIINDFLKERIINNFNDLLNNVIPTFGHTFFDRIIKYNENFKISSLYDNLRFSVTETLLYYISLEILADVEALPKDLQIRLFKLNDLDNLIEDKNKKILEILESQATDFINESKIKIIDKYYAYLQNDAIISQSFTNTILSKINDSLVTTMPEMGNNYKNMLNKYLKERLILSYKNVLNAKTGEIKRFVRDQKESLKSKIGGFFSLDSDQVLTNVNNKIDNTLKAIDEYNQYSESFDIQNDLIQFLNDYAKEYVQPIFQRLNTELNKQTKEKIIENLESNSKMIEELNDEDFISHINNFYLFYNSSYINFITNEINKYGLSNYSNHLESERNQKKERLRRRLDGTQTEAEMAQNTEELIFDQGIEDSFKKMFKLLTNARINFDSLNAFKFLDDSISNNIQKVIEKYKESKRIIEENEYEEDVQNYLTEKLSNLTNKLKHYYNHINESYYILRNYLNESIKDFEKNYKNCANITYKVFNKEFDKIINKTEGFSTTINENKYKEIDTYTKNTEHKSNSVNSTLADLKERGEFKFDLAYKGENIKNLIVMAKIINRSRPNKLKIDINTNYSFCGKIVNALDIDFKETNFTMDIIYDSEINKINLTTFTYVEGYDYYLEVYRLNSSSSKVNVSTDTNSMNLPGKCKLNKKDILIKRHGITFNTTNETDSFIIDP